MKTVAVVIFLGSLAYNQADAHLWVNSYTKPFDFNCPSGQVISYLESNYDQASNDRVWEFDCRTIATTSECVKTDWTNNKQEHFTFSCPHSKVVTGIEGNYDVGTKTRQYRFNCCKLNGNKLNNCSAKNVPFGGRIDVNVTAGYGLYSISDNIIDGVEEFYFSFCKN